jgi:hypothetical protein
MRTTALAILGLTILVVALTAEARVTEEVPLH